MTAPRTSAARRLRSALDSLARRTASKPGRKPRLAIQSLEDRVVLHPYTGPIPYEVTGVPGASVIIIGDQGTQSSGTTDEEGWTYPPAPLPWYGVAGTEFWASDVVLPPGYKFWQNDKDSAIHDPVWNPSGIYGGIALAGPDDITPIPPGNTCPAPGTNLLPVTAATAATAPPPRGGGGRGGGPPPPRRPGRPSAGPGSGTSTGCTR
jgi:hypothetical protein